MKLIPNYPKMDLIEVGQNIQSRFAWATEVDDKLLMNTPWVKCRDYLLDCLVHENTGTHIRVYGFVLSKDVKVLDLDNPILLLEIKKGYSDKIDFFVNEVNADLLKLVGVEECITKYVPIDEDTFAFYLNPVCVANTVVLSLVTATMRYEVNTLYNKGGKASDGTSTIGQIHVALGGSTTSKSDTLNCLKRLLDTYGNEIVFNEFLLIENLDDYFFEDCIEYNVHDGSGFSNLGYNVDFYIVKNHEIPNRCLYKKFLDSLKHQKK
jgi:hypothetical protein